MIAVDETSKLVVIVCVTTPFVTSQ